MSLADTSFILPGQTSFYRGKVRDVYEVGYHFIVVTTDRISAFDHVLPRAIPFKGQVLNQTAAHFLQATKDIVPNWLRFSPHPNVAIGVKCEPFKVEMVVRGYLAGHAWRIYKNGGRVICGIKLPEGLLEGDRLPTPILTPTTKASEGHDEDISREEIIGQGIVAVDKYRQIEEYALALFERGQEMAFDRGLILVDTKYEFGLFEGEICLMDEIHTPDSSRYYYLDGYAARQASGLPQRQLSKEFVREWLMSQGFQGKEGQSVPSMPDEFVAQVSERYIELYESITGNAFVKANQHSLDKDIHEAILLSI